MNEVKKITANVMFTTGAALVILAVFLVLFDKELNYASAVLQIFTANIVINVGLFLLWKLEIRYLILQYFIDVIYIIAVLVSFGAVFAWYSTVPVWLLAVMAVVIYIFATIISINKSKKDADEINELLQKRKEKQGDNAA